MITTVNRYRNRSICSLVGLSSRLQLQLKKQLLLTKISFHSKTFVFGPHKIILIDYASLLCAIVEKINTANQIMTKVLSKQASWFY